MDYCRHIVMDLPGMEAQVQVFEYDANMVVWHGASFEIFTQCAGKTIKDIVKQFIKSLQFNGGTVVSDSVINKGVHLH